MLSLLTDVRIQVDWLRRVNPRYLLTYPSNLSALLELFESAGERLPGLSQVRTIGETVTPELRDSCQRVWGVPVVDIYRSQEFGYIALQCPVVIATISRQKTFWWRCWMTTECRAAPVKRDGSWSLRCIILPPR